MADEENKDKDEGKKMPLNDEHMEAFQCDIDKQRYDMMEKMTEEEKVRFRKMEDIVVQLKTLGCPFVLLSAPEDEGTKFWRYQYYSKEAFPPSDEEDKKIRHRMFNAFAAHASFYAEASASRIQLQNTEGIPYYQINAKSTVGFNPQIYYGK
jgi:hypothetical protein